MTGCDLSAAMPENYYSRVSISKAFPSVSRSVPMSLIVKILFPDLASHDTSFPISFSSFTAKLGSHFFLHLALLKPSLIPTPDSPSEIDGLLLKLCWTDHHFLLATSSGFLFIFLYLWFPCQVHQASLGGKGFEGQGKKLGCRQAINEQYEWIFLSEERHGWTCFGRSSCRSRRKDWIGKSLKAKRKQLEDFGRLWPTRWKLPDKEGLGWRCHGRRTLFYWRYSYSANVKRKRVLSEILPWEEGKEIGRGF